MTRRGRVLLLEDDAQIRRFVSMVLSASELDLFECECVEQALRVLEQGPLDVVLCDLMLAGESGFDLIERIAGHPDWRAARVIVFSAAVDGEDRARMQALGVWGQLPKPTSVAELTRCVNEALAGVSPPPMRGEAAADASTEAHAAPRVPDAADEAEATARFFEGDAALFRAYRDASRGQFLSDVRLGDQACIQGDMAAMRRLAHSLKTVVRLLGAAALADRFAALEVLARDGRVAEVRGGWSGLCAWLQMLARDGVPPPG